MPKISVLIGAYNAESFICNALASLENQTFKDFEVVIINDGSTDCTEKAIEKFMERQSLRIVYFAQPENRGLASALNKAISLASGEYIARMDADDISLPARFEKSIEFFLGKNYDFITTRANCYKGGKMVSRIPRLVHSRTESIYSSRVLKFGNIFVHGTFFGRRKLFEEVLYDEQYSTSQDYDFLCRLSLSGLYSMGFLDEVTYQVNVVENSLGRKVGSRQFLNSEKIAKKYFGSSCYLIPPSGMKRILLLPIKYKAFRF